MLPYLVVRGSAHHRRARRGRWASRSLAALMVVAAIFALIRFVKFDPRTSAAFEVVDARNIGKRLKTAPTAYAEVDDAGTVRDGNSRGNARMPVHAMRDRGARGDGSGGDGNGTDSSDGSGGGDAGCGGGCRG